MTLLYSFAALALGASQVAAQGGFDHGGFNHGDHSVAQPKPESHFMGPGSFGGRGRPPTGPWRGEGQTASPKYNEMFQNPLPAPVLAVPEFSEEIGGRTIDYYSITIEEFEKQVYQDLGPTTVAGYNGIVPGPMFIVERYHETVIRCLNNGPRHAAIHLHGSYTHAPWDGWAEDEVDVGQYKDYYYPNSENARSIWYHDHIHGDTATNAYFGQVGLYIIHDPAEDSLGLPSGDYDIPLGIADKRYQEDGNLVSPDGETINFFGDVIHVNDEPWPYLQVEPRKYRFRFYDMSLSRAYDLYFEDENGGWIGFNVIGSDSGLFGSPVPTSDVVISMGERYEIVIDFAAYSGQNITLKNGLLIEHINDFENTDLVMMFVVGDSVSDDSNNGDVPATLNPDIRWPEPKSTIDHSFDFQQGGGGAEWTINGIPFTDVNNRILAKPAHGTTELWELRHTGGPAIHPVHIHLVNLQVISRTGGTRGVLPYENAGLKDTVLLEPGEIVQVLAYYGPWEGVYMFHCHNLIHEDHVMMAGFNVTLLEDLGYDWNTTIGFADPMDERFLAKDYDQSEFEPEAIRKAVSSYAALNAYESPESIQAYHNGQQGTAAPVAESAAATPSIAMSQNASPASEAPQITPAPSGPPTQHMARSADGLDAGRRRRRGARRN